MRILYLDIETAPNEGKFWGLFKQNIGINQITKPGYTLCFAAKWSDSKEITFSSVYGDGNDVMMRKMWALLDHADVVVHYNGKKFDIPKLNKEFVLLRLPPPSSFKQADLYHTVRSNFSFASNKLDFVCEQLGLGNKVRHKGMSLWDGCMDGNEADWKAMERYNKQDVRLLPRLHRRLLPWIRWPLSYALFDPHPKTCPNCGKHTLEKLDTPVYPGTVNAYEAYKCKSRYCGANARSRLPIKYVNKPHTIRIV